jgi:serine-type D-Ala-D-Ala carboxypeptidase/endopeptidase (penicillin-binding protein 4)
MRYTPCLLLLFLMSFCSPVYIPKASAQTPPIARDPALALREELNRLFSDPRLAQAQINAEVFSLDRSEILFEKNPQQLFIPASTNKIITAAVALMRLGPEYRFETRAFAEGPIENGMLKGNLVIVGSGDPTHSAKFNAGDPFAVFRAWAGKLKEKGIQTIAGAIIGDDGAFRKSGPGMGWEWNDLSYAYAAPAGALQFNENMVALQILPGKEPGNPAEVRGSPLENYLKIINQIATVPVGGPTEIQVEYGEADETINISGTVPAKGPAVVQTVAVRRPTHYYLAALQAILSGEGIRTNSWRIAKGEVSGPQPSSLLWTHDSPPLSEIVKYLLKNSLNLYAETLVRALGLSLRGEGSVTRGKEVIEETLGQIGITAGSYLFADGSGLSRLNLESADSFIRLLRCMQRDRNFQIFYDSLPIAGIDGTLAARMKKTRAENNVRAKTGTMSNVSSLAGYVKTADGEMLAFSIAVNNALAAREVAESIQDKALDKLAGFSRK